MILGHVLWNIINLAWCRSVAHSGNEHLLALIMSIIIPLANGLACLFAAFKCKPTTEAKGLKCCCKEASTCRNVCRRVTVGLIGVWHLFIWHSGYIIAPVFLIIASILPSKAADFTLESKEQQNTEQELVITSERAKT